VAKYKSYISPGIKRGVERSRPCLVPKNILDFGIVAFSFLFDKYYPIMDYLGSKDSSRDLLANCAISFCFRLYLLFHACATRFDVTGNLEKFLVFGVN
jgi:hypothetical protein